jgi:hypothetical protein
MSRELNCYERALSKEAAGAGTLINRGAVDLVFGSALGLRPE